jgi:hypothetical protein
LSIGGLLVQQAELGDVAIGNPLNLRNACQIGPIA